MHALFGLEAGFICEAKATCALALAFIGVRAICECAVDIFFASILFAEMCIRQVGQLLLICPLDVVQFLFHLVIRV